MNRHNDKINEEYRLEGNIDNALYLDDALIELKGVNNEVRRTYNTKIGVTLVDGEEIEYCGAHRASYKKLGGVEGVNKTDERGSSDNTEESGKSSWGRTTSREGEGDLCDCSKPKDNAGTDGLEAIERSDIENE